MAAKAETRLASMKTRLLTLEQQLAAQQAHIDTIEAFLAKAYPPEGQTALRAGTVIWGTFSD